MTSPELPTLVSTAPLSKPRRSAAVGCAALPVVGWLSRKVGAT